MRSRWAGLAVRVAGVVAVLAGACVIFTAPVSAGAAESPPLPGSVSSAGALRDAVAASSSSHRYVAFGDSVPYGHGLANPNKQADSGLRAEQGPSSEAWPSLVDKGVPGLAPLKLRPTSCGLTDPKGAPYDQLAFSGAPTQPNKWTGIDSTCVYPKGTKVPPHKAVVPNEVDAADLKADPPSLVTIQAGADDINFSGCLKALLGMPSQLGANNCVTHNKSGYHLTTAATAELKSVQTGLQKAIGDVLAAAPDAQILLVDYYQLAPAATTPIHGTSLLCRDMRLHAASSKSWRASFRAAGEYVQGQLNGVIKAAAKVSQNVAVVDIAAQFNGHEMCTANSWIFTDATWRYAHPTKTGQQKIADAVISECKRLPQRCLGRTPLPVAAEAPVPANAAADPQASLGTEACPSVAVCVAGGSYDDSSGHQQGLLVTGSGKSWSAVEAPLPANAAGSPVAEISSVACPSAASCVAAGSYEDSSGDLEGLLLTGSGKSWSAAQAPLPANAVGLNAAAPPLSVICRSAGVCVAVGSYTDSLGYQYGLLLTGSGKSWSAVEAPLPANAAADPHAELSSVACPSAAVCVAAGTYAFSDTGGGQEGLLLTGSGKSWSAVEAPLPANADPAGNVVISSVACSSAAVCMAVGSYYLSSFAWQGLLLAGSRKSWSAVEAPLPANAAGPDDDVVVISSVACPSAAGCLAVGSYDVSTLQDQQGLLLTGSGKSWSAVEAPRPANAGPGTAPTSMACPSAAVCVAGGTYVSDSSTQQQGLLLRRSETSWSAVEAPLPANASADPSAVISSVTCPSATVCVAAGSYSDSSGDERGLLVTWPA
jgi:hypothetical protein